MQSDIENHLINLQSNKNFWKLCSTNPSNYSIIETQPYEKSPMPLSIAEKTIKSKITRRATRSKKIDLNQISGAVQLARPKSPNESASNSPADAVSKLAQDLKSLLNVGSKNGRRGSSGFASIENGLPFTTQGPVPRSPAHSQYSSKELPPLGRPSKNERNLEVFNQAQSSRLSVTNSVKRSHSRHSTENVQSLSTSPIERTHSRRKTDGISAPPFEANPTRKSAIRFQQLENGLRKVVEFLSNEHIRPSRDDLDQNHNE
jgi:hypothetical protein